MTSESELGMIHFRLTQVKCTPDATQMLCSCRFKIL
jgi:hypothetical protein